MLEEKLELYTLRKIFHFSRQNLQAKKLDFTKLLEIKVPKLAEILASP